MSEHTKLFERAAARYDPPDLPMDDLLKRRDRKRRNQRIAAGVVGIAVFVAAVWIVTSGLSFDRTETPAVPGETGPTTTRPTVLPWTDYLLDLDTGEVTPLPEAIVGTNDISTDDVTGSYTVSPDASKLAYVGPGDNGERQIFVANLDGTGIDQVTNDLGAYSPAWSPHGSTIAYLGRRRGGHDNVFLLDLGTGASKQLTFEEEGMSGYPTSAGPTPLSFSPDGSSIIYSVWRGDGGEVRIVPIAGGESERLVGGDGNNAGDGQLSPDGSLLSFGCADPDVPWSRCLANADGTDARVLVPSRGEGLTHASWSPDGTRLVYMRYSAEVFVVDIATGEVTRAAHGAYPRWLDDHTLIVETDRCNQHDNRCPG